MTELVIALLAGLGFALVLLGWGGWSAVSRETNRRNPQ